MPMAGFTHGAIEREATIVEIIVAHSEPDFVAIDCAVGTFS